MEELFAFISRCQEYLRLEQERQKLIEQIVELEVEASRTYITE